MMAPPYPGGVTSCPSLGNPRLFSPCRYASSPAFLGIGLLNEPNSRGAPVEFLKQYYTEAYQAVRRHAPCAYVTVGLPLDTGG